MADNEVSKITWIAIVVALAGSVYGVTKIQGPLVTGAVFDKIGKIVGVDKVERPESPNPNDAKWVEKGNYGTNGYFVRDNAGNGIVYALDPQQPILAPETAVLTKSNDNLTSLQFLDKIILPKNSNNYFAYNSNLATFETKNLDTSNVTSMSGMFAGTYTLTMLDVSKFDTSNVTDMGWMFYGMHALTTLDVSNFNTSNVTDMGWMFGDMHALTALDVSKFNTSNVTNMNGMFNGSSALTALDVSNFNTSNVTDVAYMFGDRYKDGHKLTPPDTSKFNTSKMTNVDQMFDDRPEVS